jgi:hypothetical protein
MSAVIDLRKHYNITITENPYVPASQRFEARDLVTFDHDPESRWNLYGNGASPTEATTDLLEQIAELAVTE